MMSLHTIGRNSNQLLNEQSMLLSRDAGFGLASGYACAMFVDAPDSTSFAYLPSVVIQTDDYGLRQLWNDSGAGRLALPNRRNYRAFASGSSQNVEPKRCPSHAERGSP